MQPRGNSSFAGACRVGPANGGSVEVGCSSAVNFARVHGAASTPVSPSGLASGELVGEMTVRFEAARKAREPFNVVCSGGISIGGMPPAAPQDVSASASSPSGTAKVSTPVAAEHTLAASARACLGPHGGADTFGDVNGSYSPSPGNRDVLPGRTSSQMSPGPSSPSLWHTAGGSDPSPVQPGCPDISKKEDKHDQLDQPPIGGLAPFAACAFLEVDDQSCRSPLDSSSGGTTRAMTGLPRTFESFVIPMKKELQEKQE